MIFIWLEILFPGNIRRIGVRCYGVMLYVLVEIRDKIDFDPLFCDSFCVN